MSAPPTLEAPQRENRSLRPRISSTFTDHRSSITGLSPELQPDAPPSPPRGGGGGRVMMMEEEEEEEEEEGVAGGDGEEDDNLVQIDPDPELLFWSEEPFTPDVQVQTELKSLKL
ncbi:unnamed protein product [Pleuronectes platessa]|uniref:Uncharacterized protein n=1 Tax=Pleuronectes platessa TaxID=8262 RepID=A0A9N7UFX6_PLEPL|nr:unnamed protein product [Pleuronectes platessa]